jgi:ABC-type bacteriocin/lantibiotic exporter with double-glycine peptidase domain
MAARTGLKRHHLKRRTRAVFVAVQILLLAGPSFGCASYQGTAKEARPAEIAREGGWVIVPGFPRVLQQADHDCGAAALAAVLGFWGQPTSPGRIAAAAGRKGQRLRASDLESYARGRGLSSYVFFGTMTDIAYEIGHGRPVIVGVGKQFEKDKAIAHYEVVIGYEPDKRQVLLLDPALGWQVNSFEGFGREWSYSKGVTMVAFLSEPSPVENVMP